MLLEPGLDSISPEYLKKKNSFLKRKKLVGRITVGVKGPHAPKIAGFFLIASKQNVTELKNE